MGSSALYHLFFIHSDTFFSLFARLDYGGICCLIMGSTYPLIFYTFACEQVFLVRNFFLITITVACTLTFVMLMHPYFNTTEARKFKGYMFVVLGISAACPFGYIKIAHNDLYMIDTSLIYFGIGGLFYIGGAMLYVHRMPEKLSPGTFDCCGASHQIFHLCVIIGATIHFNESMKMFISRHDKVCPINLPVAYWQLISK